MEGIAVPVTIRPIANNIIDNDFIKNYFQTFYCYTDNMKAYFNFQKKVSTY